MSPHTARFYFANLGADVMRCVLAAEHNDQSNYDSSLDRAHKTLAYIHDAGRPEAYEEGLLLLRALEYARASNELGSFRGNLNRLISSFTQR